MIDPKDIKLAPSILAANFFNLGEQVLEAERAGVDRIHVDVMDGHFVPNLSMGPVVVQGLRPVTKLPLEIHLMVEQPDRFFDSFAEKGADTLIVHHEIAADPRALLKRIHDLGKKAGVAVRPDTPVEVLEPLLAEMDVALCMTVHPGFAGQHFLAESPARIRKLRELIQRHNPVCELEVDGGIDQRTAHTVVGAGANVLVAATAVFGDPQGPAAGVRALAAAV